ncbi:hypothetical protein [Vibrio phage VP4B]|uniref:Tail fiber protein n=1 Tax=Vibrio phage VP4B TaxID=1262540 RepID=V9M0B7_9CAUD|nr:tail fiber protein [Vibrio phage VP4B]AGB07276.1 hypothetical protein [Vibrio phage VP4B]
MSYLNYPWNPFGDNPECLVPNESVTALGDERDLLVPRYGPFFEKDFILKDAQTGAVLKPGRDFVFVYPFVEFIKQYSRTVYGGLTLLSSGKNRQLTIESYKTLGEPFTMSDQDFINLSASIIHTDRIANWSQVVNLPMEGFPPDPHAHEPDLTYNYQALIDVLTRLDQGQRDEFNNPTVASELVEHINKAFKLAHPSASAEDFNLGKVANFAPATDADLAGNSDQLYLTLAKGRKLTEQILDDLGLTPDTDPVAPGDTEDLDAPITLKEALALFLSKEGLLGEVHVEGSAAQREARLNLGLKSGAVAEVVQALGTSIRDVVSQKLLTEELAKKVPETRKINGKPLTSDITIDSDSAGTYPKKYIDDELNKKFDKANVVQATGSATDKVISQKVVTDELSTKVPNSRKVNGKPLTSDISLGPADVGTYSKSEIDANDKAIRDAAVLKAQLSESTGNNTEIAMSQKGVTNAINTRVPNGRRVNGKPLSSDITLNAGDVGAYSKSEADNRYNNYILKSRMTNSTGSSTNYVMTQKGVTDQLNDKVPRSRKVNGKVLTSDITLNASDVGAYTKAEVDARDKNYIPKSAMTNYMGTSTNHVVTQKGVYDAILGRVPTNRTVNGKALTGNITLSAGDVGAYTKSEVNARDNNKLDKSKLVQGVGPYSDNIMSQKAVTDELYKRVPTSRKVNGKALTGNITLTASDIGLSNVENKKWTKIKTGTASWNLANGRDVYRGEFYTGVINGGRRFDEARYKLVLETDSRVESSNPNACWWSCWHRLEFRQYWNKGNQLWGRVYCSGNAITSGKVDGWQLWEWR